MSEHDDPSSDPNTDADAEADADPTAIDDESAATDDAGETGSGGRLGTESRTHYLQWAGIAVLALTAVVALFGFYTGVSRAISVWVSSSYRPLVNAAFNLALLLAALSGIGLLLRRSD